MTTAPRPDNNDDKKNLIGRLTNMFYQPSAPAEHEDKFKINEFLQNNNKTADDLKKAQQKVENELADLKYEMQEQFAKGVFKDSEGNEHPLYLGKRAKFIAARDLLIDRIRNGYNVEASKKGLIYIQQKIDEL